MFSTVILCSAFYISNPIVLDNTANSSNKITNECCDCCDAEISLPEIVNCIKCLKENKSPGNDGLRGEFYKSFSFKIAPLLLAVLKESVLKK